MHYRKEIDGLRAVAVTSVILFHANVTILHGGYVGVDVFFVISGFLITSLIMEDKRAGTFSLAHFYERRARRILPALFLVAFCCALLARMWMLPDQLKLFGQSLIPVCLFASNIKFAQETGYFAPSADETPLLHTWSLAVEEQFYLLFPLFMLLAWPLGRRKLALVLGVIMAASLGLAEWASQTHPVWNFYLLPSRAFELAIGSLAAIRLAGRSPAPGALNELGALLGVFLIGCAILCFDENTPFPSIYTLAPTLGAALIVCCCAQGGLVGRILSSPPFVGVGLISYSAYLWHYPLFVFLRIRSLDAPTPSMYVAVIGVIFLLAYASWRWVERPFRDVRRVSLRGVSVMAVAGVSFCVAAGTVWRLTNGEESRLDPAVRAALAFQEDYPPNRGQCQATSKRYIAPSDACVFGKGPHEVVVRGDSHAGALMGVLAESADRLGVRFRELTYGACIPVRGLQLSNRSDECLAFNEAAHDYISKHDVKIVIIMARFTVYLEGLYFDNQEGGQEKKGQSAYVIPSNESSAFISNPSRVDVISKYLNNEIESLLANGLTVVLSYPIPEVGWNVPGRLARKILNGQSGDITTSYQVFERRNALAYRVLDAIPNHSRLIRIKPADLFCNTYIAGRCAASVNNVPLYYDDNHVSSGGARLIVNEIVSELQKREATSSMMAERQSR